MAPLAMAVPVAAVLEAVVVLGVVVDWVAEAEAFSRLDFQSLKPILHGLISETRSRGAWRLAECLEPAAFGASIAAAVGSR